MEDESMTKADGALDMTPSDFLACYEEDLETGLVMVWRRHRKLTLVQQMFLDRLTTDFAAAAMDF